MFKKCKQCTRLLIGSLVSCRSMARSMKLNLNHYLKHVILKQRSVSVCDANVAIAQAVEANIGIKGPN